MSDTPERARGSNTDRVRQHNLSTVLGLVHRSEGRIGVDRSALTQSTGLNRSTIAALVGELVELGLVVETEPVASFRVGRPSLRVSASPDVVAFAVNPEIDAVTVGVVGLDGTVQRRIRRETDGVPTAPEAAALAASTIEAMARELGPSARIVGIGVAVPGLVRRSDGLVRLAPHLGWVDEPFVEILRNSAGLPVQADNDASLGAQAESIFGAGSLWGAEPLTGTMVYLNGGASGVGGGVIVDGRPFGGTSGYAGEFGHTLVNSNGEGCHCGAIGCLETEVGQASLLRVVGLPLSAADELGSSLASTTDPVVVAEVDRQIDYLAIALRNIINTFDPEVIVLGGFLGALSGRPGVGLLEKATATALPGPSDSLEIRPAYLGGDRLLIGAAELAFAPLIADPGQLPLAR